MGGLPDGDGLRGEYAERHALAIEGWYENYDEESGHRGEREEFVADTILWWRGLTGHDIAYWAANVHTASVPELTYRWPAWRYLRRDRHTVIRELTRRGVLRPGLNGRAEPRPLGRREPHVPAGQPHAG